MLTNSYLSDNLNKCRICLRHDSEMNSFFNVFFEDMSLAQVFANITSYEVQADDRLPKNICRSCKTNIINFNNMISVFQETEIYLLKKMSEYDVKCEIGDFETRDLKDSLVGQNDDDTKDGINDFTESYLDQNDIDENECLDNDLNTNVQAEATDRNIAQRKSENENMESQRVAGYGNPDYNIIISHKYTCDCGDCFLHKSGFRQHMQYRHNKLLEGQDFENYSEKIELKMPIDFPNNIEYVPSKILIRKNKLQCRVCPASFLTDQEVKIHEEVHKTYICDHCGSAFLKKHYLSDHLRIHTDEKHYTCKICKKSFKHRYTYSVHQRSHDTTRNYICDICGASFKTGETLRTHIHLKHSNIRNYPCPNCNLKFNLKSTLSKHILRKHTANRTSFVCSKCGASYLNKTTLTRHEEEKHLGKLKYHACTICENKMFVMKKALKAHMLKKHGVVPE